MKKKTNQQDKKITDSVKIWLRRAVEFHKRIGRRDRRSLLDAREAGRYLSNIREAYWGEFTQWVKHHAGQVGGGGTPYEYLYIFDNWSLIEPHHKRNPALTIQKALKIGRKKKPDQRHRLERLQSRMIALFSKEVRKEWPERALVRLTNDDELMASVTGLARKRFWKISAAIRENMVEPPLPPQPKGANLARAANGKLVVNRAELLTCLEMVKPGLGAREREEQFMCFAFEGGNVFTYNGEIFCEKRTGFDFTGAIQGKPLLEILSKLDDEELLVRRHKEDGELQFKGKDKAFGLTMDDEVFLAIKDVETPKENQWMDLPEGFFSAVSKVHPFVSKYNSDHAYSCIHLHPDRIEACDYDGWRGRDMQAMRYKIGTGLKESVAVRAKSIAPVLQTDVDEMAVTESWLHFRSRDEGFRYSCRHYKGKHPKLDSMFRMKGHLLVLPDDLAEACEKAPSSAAAIMEIENGELKVGTSSGGGSEWYAEKMDVAYEGPPISICLSLKILRQLAERHAEVLVGEERIKVVGESWEYVTAIENASEDED